MAEDQKLAEVIDNGHATTSYQREYIESLRPRYDRIAVHMRDHVNRSILLLFRHKIVIDGREYHHSGCERVPAEEPKTGKTTSKSSAKKSAPKTKAKPKVTAKKSSTPKRKSAAKPKVAA